MSKEEFKQYAAFGRDSHKVRKIVSKKMGEFYDLCDPIANPREALKILAEVTGEKTMVEKIKEYCQAKRCTSFNDYDDGRNDALSLLLFFIEQLEAEQDKP